MTPLSFEWKWAADYFIFMGLLYLALGIIGCGVIVAYLRAWFEVDEEDKLPPKIESRSEYSKY